MRLGYCEKYYLVSSETVMKVMCTVQFLRSLGETNILEAAPVSN